MIQVRLLLPIEANNFPVVWMMREIKLPIIPPLGSPIYVGSYRGSPPGDMGHAIERRVEEIWVRENVSCVCVVLDSICYDKDESLWKDSYIDLAAWQKSQAVQFTQYGFRQCQQAPRPTQPNFMHQL